VTIERKKRRMDAAQIYFTCVKFTYVHLPSFPHLTYEDVKAQEGDAAMPGDHYIGRDYYYYYYILPAI
jgi:hypothetical protein